MIILTMRPAPLDPKLYICEAKFVHLLKIGFPTSLLRRRGSVILRPKNEGVILFFNTRTGLD